VEKMSNVLSKFEQEFGLTVNNEGKIVTSSLKVAEYYGKEHKDVLEKIRKFIDLIPELGQRNFSPSSYLNKQRKRQPIFTMDRQGFSMLVNKFTGDEATLFTYRYTKAFEEMAEELAEKREYVQAITDKVIKDKVLTLDDLNAIRFSTGRTIKTFANADMKTIDDLVHDFNEYVANMDSATRMTRAASAIAGIERLHDRLALDGVSNIGNCYNLKQLIIDIKDYRHKIENKKNGGQKAAQTKAIKKLQMSQDELVKKVKNLTPPDISKYFVIDKHPFSENYIVDADIVNGKPKLIKPEVYRQWQKEFPTWQLPNKEDINIDWSKPIISYLRYVHQDTFDMSNFDKSFHDFIFAYYNENDRYIRHNDHATMEFCNHKSEGKIYWLLRNI